MRKDLSGNNIVYRACSYNAEGRPCLGDLVAEGKVEKKYFTDPYDSDHVEWMWTNVSNETFLVYLSEKEDIKFVFEPGGSI